MRTLGEYLSFYLFVSGANFFINFLLLLERFHSVHPLPLSAGGRGAG